MLGTIPLAVIARQTRSAMLEVMGEDYVRTARSKGLSNARVTGVHAFRNALIPVVTTIGLQVGTLLAGAILTETIFSWPGIGKWMIDAIGHRDYTVVQGGLLLIAIIVHGGEPRGSTCSTPSSILASGRGRKMADDSPAATRSHHFVAKPQDARLQVLGEFWHYFSQNRGAVTGLVVFVLLIVMAVFAPFIAPHDPSEQFRDNFLQPPFWQEGGSWQFILGTDDVGRDMLSLRIILRRPLFPSHRPVRCYRGAGLGRHPGPAGRLFPRYRRCRRHARNGRDPGLSRRCSWPWCWWRSLGPGLVNAMIAIAIVLQPHFARLTRAAVMAEKNREYVTSAKVAGASHIRLMLVTILPNCIAPLIVQATLSFSNAILEAAALGFLGMGAQPPTPEWGTMLAEAREFILRAWWVVTLPGLAILITVLAINLMGDGLRDALDPKLKRS